jgi:hypothetical protein
MSFPESPYDPQRSPHPAPPSAPQVAVGPPPRIGGPQAGPAFSGPPVAPMGWPYAPPPPPRKRRIWPWIVGGAALLVMLLVGGLVLIGVVVAANRASDIASRKPLGSAATPAPANSYTNPLPDPAYPAPTGPATNRTHTAKVGETIVWERRGFEADWRIVSTEQKAVAEFNQKPTRGLFLLAHLTVAQKQGSNFACACTLQFVAANGRVYQNDFNSFAKHERFQSQNVGPGQTLDGWVAFDVPADAVKGGKIQWSPNLIDDDLRGYWLL